MKPKLTNSSLAVLKRLLMGAVGYKHVNWYSFTFDDSNLTSHSTGTALSDELKASRDLETRAELETAKTDTSARDIGWFGLPEATRNQITRNHVTQVSFTFFDDTTISDSTIYVIENGIKIRHDNTSDSPPSFTEVGNPAIEIPFAVRTP